MIAAAVFMLLTSLHGMAVFFTNYLWYRSVDLGRIWSGVLLAKVELAVAFVGVFAAMAWLNLAVVDRLAIRHATFSPDDELVQRYRAIIMPRARLVRTLVSVVLAFLVGAGAASEWRQWILFRHAVPFGIRDPLFHLDVSFYVFRLPFLSFAVSWLLAALVVLTLLVSAASYLTGGIRPQGVNHKVSPHVKAHLSVLLAAAALVKAAGYFLQRYSLDLSNFGYAQGAFYTDVHARLPALTLLIVVSLLACVVLMVNIRRQGWTLPGIAVGLWALVSVLVGVIYPAVIQRFFVQPSQLSKELPYIARNIDATRYAMGINRVATQSFAYSQNITPGQVARHAQSLSNARLWDPSIAADTFNKLQDIRSYYTFNSLSVNRLQVAGRTIPVIVGVRQLNSSQLPAQSWVNEHLQFTHGYGAIVSPANTAASDGNPNFLVRDIPQVASPGAPALTEPRVYYGPGQTGYAIANSKQPEIDYQSKSGATLESHYAGSGGVPLSSLLRRAAFALRFGDLNALISGQITPQSRLMFVRDIQTRVAKAAPFLVLGSHPYAVLVNGQISWVMDAYTTSSHYPYAQPPSTGALSADSPLQNVPFNYIRNTVKVVVNAYSGKMTLYTWGKSDPIIRSYEESFPGVFTPAATMPEALKAQLRYPKDLFTLQASTYGRYHITDPVGFYNAGNAWTLSAEPGSGSPGTSGSAPSSTQPQRMMPQYSQVQLPGAAAPSFVLLEPFVPLSQDNVQQNLTAFLVAGSDPGSYGQLTSYVMPSGQQIDGPDLVNAKINDNTTVSSEISLLDQHGSTVQQGTVMLLPVGQSLLYVRPLYVSSSQNPLPEVKEVIVVYGNTVTMEPTLAEALDATFGSHLASSASPQSPISPSTTPTSGPPPQVAVLAQEAAAALAQAQSDLKAGNLGGYQAEVDQASQLLAQAAKVQAGLAPKVKIAPVSPPTTAPKAGSAA